MRKGTGLSIGLALGLLLTVSGCTTTSARPQVSQQVATGQTLTVALYPYVPRQAQFQAAITTAWASVQPNVPLTFLDESQWDGGYKKDPPANADVYVFDAMFFEYFRAKGWLEAMAPSEIANADDFVQYAKAGVQSGGSYYAIPQLGCASILFYQKTDTALDSASTLSEVKNALSQCTYTSKVPPDRRGLMVDMSGGTTNAATYLATLSSLTGAYPPPLSNQIDPAAMSNVRLLLAMASYENGTDGSDQRPAWFSQGWGRAVIGFTESMSAMSPETRLGIDFKVMPLSDNDNSPMFYADVVGVNTTTNQRGTRNLAVQLANLMASRDTMLASIGPDGTQPYPQFLMATRPSVFQSLGQSFPIYNEMYSLVTQDNPVMFKLDAGVRDWLTAMKTNISNSALSDYPCGCDFPADGLITDDSAAAAACNPVCAGHGGWSGTWTNQPPAAQDGNAACGCNACPVPQ
ncbi:MAG TPA: thiamine pyridinylase [Thermoanaerobaculia bacterium]|jgi:thiamine pyridinylase|nr:thiamine pyridinylase [Thermoanaerobaculia bacterium]